MTPPPLAVIFDYGGVILDMRSDVCQALETEHSLPSGSVFTTLYRSEAWTEVERGRGDREGWRVSAHAALERLAGRSLPPLHEQWRAACAPSEQNVRLIRALRPAYRLSILSNADITLRSRLEQFGILDLFADVVCSAEVGLAKPDPEIYTLACRRLEVAPAQTVFVDDHEPNVRAAAEAGLRSILYCLDRGDDLRTALGAAGITVPVATEV